MSDLITLDHVKAACPANLRRTVNQEFVDQLNNLHSDPYVQEAMQERALGFVSVLAEGRYKIEDYLNAVRFVTYRMSDSNQQEAYIKTFPDRYKRHLADGLSKKDISAYASMYAKGKLVASMMDRAMIPVWLVNADNVQKMINVQVELALTASSEMVRTTAANSVLTHVKRPEVAKMDVTVDNKEGSSRLAELREVVSSLTGAQLDAINSGTMSTKEVAHSEIVKKPIDDDAVDGEFTEV